MKFTCDCGATDFETNGEPLFRILCHCTICQRFNSAPFGDVLVFEADNVSLPPQDAVNFQTYKPPPNVKRGKCAACAQPAVEVFSAPLFPRLVIVPAPMLKGEAGLPKPVAHMFYEKRVSDADDLYPKHHGFLRSELAFLNYLRRAKRRA